MGSAVPLGSGAGPRGLSASRAGRGARYGRLVSRADGLGFRPGRAMRDGCYVQQPEGTRAPSVAVSALLGILTVPGFLGWPVISIIYYSGRFRCAFLCWRCVYPSRLGVTCVDHLCKIRQNLLYCSANKRMLICRVV